MSKTPNLVQRQTGVYQYPPAMKLPPVVSVPLQPTIAPVRPNTAPMIPNRTPGGPLGTATNTPAQVR
jgi:hypothetical protein